MFNLKICIKRRLSLIILLIFSFPLIVMASRDGNNVNNDRHGVVYNLINNTLMQHRLFFLEGPCSNNNIRNKLDSALHDININIITINRAIIISEDPVLRVEVENFYSTVDIDNFSHEQNNTYNITLYALLGNQSNEDVDFNIYCKYWKKATVQINFTINNI